MLRDPNNVVTLGKSGLWIESPHASDFNLCVCAEANTMNKQNGNKNKSSVDRGSMLLTIKLRVNKLPNSWILWDIGYRQKNHSPVPRNSGLCFLHLVAPLGLTEKNGLDHLVKHSGG